MLLSVGYSACHWCHVMAHESFSDPQIAAFVNEHFVAIKVDREERPDVDAVYMEATQAMTGQGGWPMTCFLTPDGQPFHCGTYYPAAAAQRDAVVPAAARGRDQGVGDRRRQRCATPPRRSRTGWPGSRARCPRPRWTRRPSPGRSTSLEGEFDRVAGGFGGAPKFPPSAVLEFLLRHHERTGSEPAWRMATATHERMARGGLFDQLAGGFARYSVDARWVVPHFEKMLYDNALLLRSYAHEARLVADRRRPPRLARHAAELTGSFLLRDLRTAEGGFASALDADAAGEEGSTYVWSPAELAEVLGAGRGRLGGGAARRHRGRHLRARPLDAADARRPRGPGAGGTAARKALLAARAARPQPARDDKVVAAWNGLAITALVEGAAALGRPDWLAAARRAAGLLLRTARRRRAGCAARRATASSATPPGCSRTTRRSRRACSRCTRPPAEPRWLDEACGLLDVALDHFAEHDEAGAPTGPSGTPPTTPRPWSAGRARSPTARRRAGPRC